MHLHTVWKLQKFTLIFFRKNYVKSTYSVLKSHWMMFSPFSRNILRNEWEWFSRFSTLCLKTWTVMNYSRSRKRSFLKRQITKWSYAINSKIKWNSHNNFMMNCFVTQCGKPWILLHSKKIRENSLQLKWISRWFHVKYWWG